MTKVTKAVRSAHRLYRDRKVRQAEEVISDAIHLAAKETLNHVHGIDAESVTHLVHYTRLEVLFSILKPSATPSSKPKGLRLYDTVHSNDPEEGMFLLNNWPPNPLWGWEIDRNEDPYSDQAQWISASSPAYILSFVKYDGTEQMNDRLAFWKEYGNGCRGCSLSIPLDQFPRNNLQLTPYQVKYGSGSVKELFKILETVLLSPLAQMNRTPGLESFIRQSTRAALHPFRYLYKDDAYADEKECRIIFTNPSFSLPADEIVFEPMPSASGTIRVRHYSSNHVLDTKALFHSESRILLGPLVSHAANVHIAIEKFLNRFCAQESHDKTIGKPSVGPSRIRYRET